MSSSKNPTPAKTSRRAIKVPTSNAVRNLGRTLDGEDNDDKATAYALAHKLKNVLKLSRSFRWLFFEFFTSSLDEPILKDNEFLKCLHLNFPALKTRDLNRMHWYKIRKMLGKPRRCSPAFFALERRSLHNKRNQIRSLQMCKQGMVPIETLTQNLPPYINLPIVGGSKVTARLRKPQNGLFTGHLSGLDVASSSYRVSFLQMNLASVASIPDFEVYADYGCETVPLSNLSHPYKNLRTILSPMKTPMTLPGSPRLMNDPILSSAGFQSPMGPGFESAESQNTSYKNMMAIEKLSVLLNKKKQVIDTIKKYNSEAENMTSYGVSYPAEFQQAYASCVLELHQLSNSLTSVFEEVQKIAGDMNIPGSASKKSASVEELVDISDVADCSDAIPRTPGMIAKESQIELEASDMAEKLMNKHANTKLSEPTSCLIKRLTALMFQLHVVASKDEPFDVGMIRRSVSDIKASLHPSSLKSFRDNLDVHMNVIQSGMLQQGSFHKFTSPDAKTRYLHKS